MSTFMGVEPTIFECPNCGETIDVSAETCRFCNAPVDRPLALHRAMILARVNQACSDATYLRSCALALPVFFVARFVPFFSWLGTLAFVALCFVIPVWAVIWWSRFSEVESQDPDYIKSRKAVKIAGISVAVVLLLFVILPFVVAFVYGMMRAMQHANSIH
jgi:hypothetical protein